MTPRDFNLPASKRERLMDLLADRASSGLNEIEAAELDVLFVEAGVDDDDSIDLAAAALTRGLVAPSAHPIPMDLRAKLIQAATSEVASARAIRAASSGPAATTPRSGTIPSPRRTPRLVVWGGWLAAAACLTLAALLWVRSAGQGGAISAIELARSIDAAPGTVSRDWGAWPAKPSDQGGVPFAGAADIKGRVVWNQQLQKGYMVFRGAPANDPASRQYQLWIIDKAQNHPIDGGVFDIAATGEVIVPIDAKIAVKDLVGFGVTEEPAGGVVVSDQNRRVVVALLGS
ncbi:MAG: anti-sigma factor [Phycisphaerales bacterium]